METPPNIDCHLPTYEDEEEGEEEALAASNNDSCGSNLSLNRKLSDFKFHHAGQT